MVPKLESRVRKLGRTCCPTSIVGETINLGWLTGGIGIELAVIILIMKGAHGVFAGRQILNREADIPCDFLTEKPTFPATL